MYLQLNQLTLESCCWNHIFLMVLIDHYHFLNMKPLTNYWVTPTCLHVHLFYVYIAQHVCCLLLIAFILNTAFVCSCCALSFLWVLVHIVFSFWQVLLVGAECLTSLIWRLVNNERIVCNILTFPSIFSHTSGSVHFS